MTEQAMVMTALPGEASASPGLPSESIQMVPWREGLQKGMEGCYYLAWLRGKGWKWQSANRR